MNPHQINYDWQNQYQGYYPPFIPPPPYNTPWFQGGRGPPARPPRQQSAPRAHDPERGGGGRKGRGGAGHGAEK